MTLNHNAIYRAYPQTAWIDDELGAYDADGNKIELDQTLVDAVAVTVAAEEAFLELRSERNKRLFETDYLALADATLTDEMKAYRQALRDLPANTADPANPVWPIKPV